MPYGIARKFGGDSPRNDACAADEVDTYANVSKALSEGCP